MSEWRENPNLAECFENCVAMLHNMPEAPQPQRGGEIKRRRKALGLSAATLARAAGFSGNSVYYAVSRQERGSGCWSQRIADTLDRLEAARQAAAAK